LVSKLSDELKKKDQEACDLRKKVVHPFKLSSGQDEKQECFKKGIKQVASTVFPGKHNKTKAQMLMEVIQDHMLFNSKAAQRMSQNTMSQIKHLFCAQKIGESWGYITCWRI
jgi:hypothetical protein